ncbi:MAG: DUF1844 domain-containing protein [Firmicutes bacterium]|nr:DUF1844 domain-containing protein [Bacillota bacterium]
MSEEIKNEQILNEEPAAEEVNPFPEQISEAEAEKIAEELKAGGQEAFDFSALLPDTIEEILKIQIFNLQEWAFVYMGLQLNPKTKKITKDIRQAKLAIDALSATVEVVMPHLPEKEQRELKTMVTNLRMNFISKSQE